MADSHVIVRELLTILPVSQSVMFPTVTQLEVMCILVLTVCVFEWMTRILL